MAGISFTIEADPVPASRPKVGKFGTYYPKAHTTYKAFLSNALKAVKGWVAPKAVAVHILLVMPRYKTSDYHVHRADVDNLAKLPMDCMTDEKNPDGSPKFWVDDCEVVHLNTSKRFAREGEKPHTRIRVIPVEGSIEDYVDGVWNDNL